jgi:hypothetical protein
MMVIMMKVCELTDPSISLADPFRVDFVFSLHSAYEHTCCFLPSTCGAM